MNAAPRSYHRVVALAVALYALPVVLDFAVCGWSRVFSYFEGDTNYYLVVARNFALHGSLTFDQSFPTNGYHPLWQFMLAGVYVLSNAMGMSDPVILSAVAFICVALISTAIWLLGEAFLRPNGRSPALFLFLPVGVLGVFMAFLRDKTGTLWDYTNGMESAVLILTYAGLFLHMVKTGPPSSWGTAAVAGILLSLLILARLDSVLMPAAYAMAVLAWITTRREWGSAKYTLSALVIVFLVLASYLAYNRLSVGLAMPVSVTLKSSFPQPYQGISKIVLLPTELMMPERSWRYLQMVAPAVFAVPGLLHFLRVLRGHYFNSLDFAMGVSAIFVILLGAYHFLFVEIGSQGFWYFPISALYMTLLVIYASPSYAKSVERAVGALRRRLSRGRASPAFLRAVAIGVMSAAVVFFYLTVFRDAPCPTDVRVFALRSSIQQHYTSRGERESPRLVEYSDGIVAYTTGFPTMSGTGFMLDREAMEAKRGGFFLRLAYERGYRYIATAELTNVHDLTYDTPSAVIRERLHDYFGYSNPREGEFFYFEISYLSPDRSFAIFRMHSRSE